MARKHPYEVALERAFERGDDVTIDRQGTTPVKGSIGEVEEEGVHLTSHEGVARGMVKHIFVAYKDMRGITAESSSLEE